MNASAPLDPSRLGSATAEGFCRELKPKEVVATGARLALKTARMGVHTHANLVDISVYRAEEFSDLLWFCSLRGTGRDILGF